MIRRVLKGLLLFVLILLVAAVILLFAGIQKTPLVQSTPAASAENALNTRSFVRGTVNKIIYAKEPVALTVSTDELNSALNLTSHALPRLQARVNIEPYALLAAATIKIPPSPLGKYINSSVYILPSNLGLQIDSVTIGSLRINGKLSQTILRLALNLLLGDGQGGVFLDSIQKVSFQPNVATVLIAPPKNMQARITKIKHRFKRLRDKANIYGDPQLAQHYYQTLMQTARQNDSKTSVSLTHYLIPLFAEARRQTEASGNPVAENRAAILALSIFLGSSQFEKLIGPVRDQTMLAFKPPQKVQLAGRRDLRLHFIYSAALKILTDQGVSVALGEYKELTDSGKGGSGFSFVDLAADRTGIYFAERATESSKSAYLIQSRIADGITEKDLFPAIADLPEGLTQQQFTSRYSDVESASYQLMVNKIDQRITALSLFRP